MPTPGEPLVKEGDLLAGRYRLLHPIGAGAMGTVWAARHELLERGFAVKVPKRAELRHPEARARFLREAQTIAKLRHPNIVDIADVGEDEGQPYLAMELLLGETLAERLTREGPLEPADAALVVASIASALAAVHRAGIVHRDLKPENIFLAKGPTGGIVPKLLDFGVSKTDDESASKHPVGTPAYMSPEQANGEADVDERTDLWSLGVVLHEALTGDKPFAAPTYAALLSRIAEQPPEPLPPSIPEPIAAVVARCLAKPRAERYANASALHDALVAAADAVGGASIVERAEELPALSARGTLRSASESLAPSIRPPRARSRKRAIGVAAGAALVGIALAIRLSGGLGARTAPTVAHGATPTPPAPTTTVTAVAQAIEPEPSPTDAAEPTAIPSAKPSASAAAASAAPRSSGRPKPTSPKHAVTHVDSAGF